MKSFKISTQSIIIDDSIVSIAQYCVKLNHLKLDRISNITDAGIILLSQNCRGLKTLHLNSSMTDASLKSISKHCIGLETLELVICQQITDEAILQLSHYC